MAEGQCGAAGRSHFRSVLRWPSDGHVFSQPPPFSYTKDGERIEKKVTPYISIYVEAEMKEKL